MRGVVNAQFDVMNAEELEFEDAAFDVIFGSGIIHHLDVPRAYSELARVLAPGGSAVFVEPLGHNPLIRVFRNRTPELRTPDEHRW
jgi:ubiquinone/menaquinone biosynthesis C-methylase UbiE